MAPSPVQPQSPNPILHARQSIQTIGGTSGQVVTCSGQYSSGTLAGAIVGTFFGTILILYLFSTIFNNKQRRSETVVVEKSRRGGNRRHRSHSGSSSIRRPSRVYSTG